MGDVPLWTKLRSTNYYNYNVIVAVKGNFFFLFFSFISLGINEHDINHDLLYNAGYLLCIHGYPALWRTMIKSFTILEAKGEIVRSAMIVIAVAESKAHLILQIWQMFVRDVWSPEILMSYHTCPHGLFFRLGVAYIIYYIWLTYSVSCHEFTQQYLLLNSCDTDCSTCLY